MKGIFISVVLIVHTSIRLAAQCPEPVTYVDGSPGGPRLVAATVNPGPSTTHRWYTSASGPEFVHADIDFSDIDMLITSLPAGNADFYISTLAEGCESRRVAVISGPVQSLAPPAGATAARSLAPAVPASGQGAVSGAPGNLLNKLRSVLASPASASLSGTAARVAGNGLVSARTPVPSADGLTSITGLRIIDDWSAPWLNSISEFELLPPSTALIGNGMTINMTYTGCGAPPSKVKFIGRSVPLGYGVSGGGTICPGEEGGMPVVLDGSQPGIAYQLLRDGIALGSAVAGDGSPIDFGVFDDSGAYTIEATDTQSGCSKVMDGQAVVIVSDLPAVEAGDDAYFFSRQALVPLAGCDPAGGRWSGPGASSIHFNPNVAGIGDHTLTYTYTDQYGCADTDTREVHVLPAPVLSLDGYPLLRQDGHARLFTSAGYDSYTWYRNGKAVSGQDGSELVVTNPGTYHVEVSRQGAVIATNSISISRAVEASGDHNYVVENTILVEGIQDVSSVDGLNPYQRMAAISYFDGLGRALQTVSAQASPAMADMIVPMVYDRFGRDSIQYLPYAASGVSGAFRPDAVARQGDFYSSPPFAVASDPAPWAVKVLEASPLSRLMEQGAPGETWQSKPDRTGKTVKFGYQTNGEGEVRAFRLDGDLPLQDGYYDAGQLFVTVTSDEHGSEVREYKDKLGLVVLKRSWLAANKYLDTYYIYDDFSNLRVVIQPEGMRLFDQLYALDREKFLDNWAFRYRYDGRQRMVEKKVPGAGWVHMVYDNRDRLVLSRDANQRDEGKWLFTKYDHFNRPVMSGWYVSSSSRAQLQEMVNEQVGSGLTYTWFESAGDGMLGYDNASFPTVSSEGDLLSVSYYDRYAFLDAWGDDYGFFEPCAFFKEDKLDIVRGQVTGTMTRVLESNSWIKSVSWYDDKYRVIQSVSGNHLGGTDRSFSRYDFVGKVMATRAVHSVPGQPSFVIEESFSYDHAGRVLSQEHRLGQGVAWTDLQGLEAVEGSALQKTAVTGWGNAGAVSEDIIPAHHNGWMEAMVSQVTGSFAIGLTGADHTGGVHLNNMLYALYTDDAGMLYVREKGSVLPTGLGVAAHDVLKVARTGGRIVYHLNDSVLYASLDHSNEDLKGMVVINSAGLAVSGLYISTAGDIMLAENAYNEIGELIDKKLHSLDEGRTAQQSLDYRYNIRGWLTGVNGEEVMGGGLTGDGVEKPDYFSFGLFYDQLPSGYAALSTDHYYPQFNGNISAMAWKVNMGLGEVTDRAYTYTYDGVNRITSAKGWTKKEERWMKNDLSGTVGAFDVNNISYDFNGNILTLHRNDADGGPLDKLVYRYGNGPEQGNRLLKVSDGGQKDKGFHDGANIAEEYRYDANGNMYKDFNKGISDIYYNYLNLPQNLDMGAKGAIRYTYDAAGIKLRKEVQEGDGVRTTDYSGPFVYEDGKLAFIQHPEGRIVCRPSYFVPRTSDLDGQKYEAGGMKYDYYSYEYHLKDHLGNVRMTFTTDPMTDSVVATLEEGHKAAEQEAFNPSYDEATRVNSRLFNHTEGEESQYSIRLSGTEGEVVGLAKALSVMPGDTIEMAVYGKYTQPTLQPADVGALLAWSLTGAFGLTSTAVGEMAEAYTAFNELFAAGAIITADDWEDYNAPKAYLNYILFDEDHQAYDFGFDQISEEALENGGGIAHDKMYLKALAKKPGYIYIYLSNENPTLVDVYFDDLTIAHHHSPVIQADDYYPFGMVAESSRLKPASLSDRAQSGTANNFLYQGQELQDDLDLGWYSFKWRNHQPDIGRFFNVDPLAEDYYYNSPYAFSENKVVAHIELEGLESYFAADGNLLGQVGTNTDVRVVNNTVTNAQVTQYIQGEDRNQELFNQSVAFAEYFTTVADVTNGAALETYTNNGQNCFAACTQQLANEGVTQTGPNDAIHTIVDANSTLTANPFGGAILTQTQLNSGNPVMVGVEEIDANGNSPNPGNVNSATGHFVVIRSVTVAADGTITFNYLDNASTANGVSDANNNFTLDATTGTMSDNTIIQRTSYETYDVTEVRRNQQ